jgi:hypothetical protein
VAIRQRRFQQLVTAQPLYFSHTVPNCAHTWKDHTIRSADHRRVMRDVDSVSADMLKRTGD